MPCVGPNGRLALPSASITARATANGLSILVWAEDFVGHIVAFASSPDDVFRDRVVELARPLDRSSGTWCTAVFLAGNYTSVVSRSVRGAGECSL